MSLSNPFSFSTHPDPTSDPVVHSQDFWVKICLFIYKAPYSALLLWDTHCSMHHCFFFLLCQIIVCCTYVPCLVHVNGCCYFFCLLWTLLWTFNWIWVLFGHEFSLKLWNSWFHTGVELPGCMGSVLVIWGTAKHVSKMGPIFLSHQQCFAGSGFLYFTSNSHCLFYSSHDGRCDIMSLWNWSFNAEW